MIKRCLIAVQFNSNKLTLLLQTMQPKTENDHCGTSRAGKAKFWTRRTVSVNALCAMRSAPAAGQ